MTRCSAEPDRSPRSLRDLLAAIWLHLAELLEDLIERSTPRLCPEVAS